MSGLRHYNNIPIEGHFSAHGMPDRPCVMSVRAVLRGGDTRTRPQSPSRCPLGIGVLFRQSGPALSSGPVSSVEVAAGPSAGRVLGNAPGPTTADRFLESASATRQQSDGVGLLSVGFSTRSTRMLEACPPCNTYTSSCRLPFLGITECLSVSSVPAATAELAWPRWWGPIASEASRACQECTVRRSAALALPRRSQCRRLARRRSGAVVRTADAVYQVRASRGYGETELDRAPVLVSPAVLAFTAFTDTIVTPIISRH